MMKKHKESDEKKPTKSQSLGFFIIFGIIAFLASVTLALSGSVSQVGFSITVGGVSPKTFKATRNVENEVATNRLKQIAMDAVVARYAVDLTINDSVMSRLETFFDVISKMRVEKTPIISNDGMAQQTSPSVSAKELPVSISANELNLLLEMPTPTYNHFRNTITQSANSALEAGIRSTEGLSKTLMGILADLSVNLTDDNEASVGFDILSEVIEPNDFVDTELTAALKEEAAKGVSPIMYQRGQNIVSNGEIVNEEAYAALLKQGLINNSIFDNLFPLIGGSLIVGGMFGLGILYLYFFNKIANKKTAVLLFTLYILGIVLIRLLSFAPFPLVPILLICMLTSILLDARLAVIMGLCLTINATVGGNFDIKSFLYYILTGLFSACLGKFTTERSKVFSIGLLLGTGSAFAAAVVCAFFDKGLTQDSLNTVVYAGMTGILTVMVCVGSLPFWESVFGVITPLKLLELTNPNNTLLRRLIIEAPGTYHHSLIVANLAETGAYDIGANPSLARVGGYYHDIGKLFYPRYFAENQAGENPHDAMTPHESVAAIKAHVAEGIKLAEKHKLPAQIKDFIVEHHGRTLIKYFYFKAKKDNPDIDESLFRYPFEIPHTPETAVLMLADTVEAAVRATVPTGKTMAEVEAIVRSLIKDKLDDGQLVSSNLKISDLETLAGSFMRVFKGMYHERIPYPKMTTGEMTGDKK